MRRALVLALLAGCGDVAPSPPPPPPSPRAAVRAAAPPIDAAPVRYVGVLTASNSIDLAPRFGGLLAKVHVEPGDRVMAGQIVAEMDPGPAHGDLNTAEAALSVAIGALNLATVNVEAARRNLEVETKAVASGVSAALSIESAQNALDRAEATEERARSARAVEESRVQIARERLADATLRAPFTGTVATRYRDAGSMLLGSAKIMRLVEDGELRLRFAMPPKHARELAPDMEISAEIDSIEAPVRAKIRRVSGTLDAASGMIIVDANLVVTPAIVRDLRPGLAAWVTR